MIVRLWGTRGSIAAPGPDTARHGGNTVCVEVRGSDGTLLVLDAGTGIRALGRTLRGVTRLHILISHFHLDHIQGLGFFEPLFDPAVETHLWAPAAPTATLRARLMRYFSPPLFPVHLRDLPHLSLHDLPNSPFTIGPFRITSERICHPGVTVGFRISEGAATMTYMSDHEPALGVTNFPLSGDWTSGYTLARDADLLIHDAQYTLAQYPNHVGWGHSAIEHALAFAKLARVRQLVTFHHDPGHDDAAIDRLTADAIATCPDPPPVVIGSEGAVFTLAP